MKIESKPMTKEEVEKTGILHADPDIEYREVDLNAAGLTEKEQELLTAILCKDTKTAIRLIEAGIVCNKVMDVIASNKDLTKIFRKIWVGQMGHGEVLPIIRSKNE